MAKEMRNLGVKEAAEAIRGAVSVDRMAHTDPEQAHGIKFARDVTRELGLNDDVETVTHVITVLREHGIALHVGHEYPKYVTRKWDRTAKIVHSEQEAHDWANEPKPEPASDSDSVAVRTMDVPVQDLSLDLKDQVPHMVEDMDRRAPFSQPKIPNAVTNREAAQDAHARQPVHPRDAAAAAYDEHNPGLGHDHADAENGNEVFSIDDLAGAGNAHQGGAPYAKPADVGVMAHDDPDRDGVEGQGVDPTHDQPAARPLHELATEDYSDAESAAPLPDPAPRKPVGERKRPL